MSCGTPSPKAAAGRAIHPGNSTISNSCHGEHLPRRSPPLFLACLPSTSCVTLALQPSSLALRSLPLAFMILLQLNLMAQLAAALLQQLSPALAVLSFSHPSRGCSAASQAEGLLQDQRRQMSSASAKQRQIGGGQRQNPGARSGPSSSHGFHQTSPASRLLCPVLSVIHLCSELWAEMGEAVVG